MNLQSGMYLCGQGKWFKTKIKIELGPVPITTDVVSLNPVPGKAYSIKHYVIKFVSDLRQVCVLV
jgi:hypothetical protein